MGPCTVERMAEATDHKSMDCLLRGVSIASDIADTAGSFRQMAMAAWLCMLVR